MAWPGAGVPNQVLDDLITPALWNAVSDAINESAPAIVTTAGDLVYATGANAIARLAIGTAQQYPRVNSGATALEYITLDFGATSTDVTIANTVTETSIFSFSIPANMLGAANYLEFTIHCEFRNNTGSDQSGTLRMKYGATPIATQTKTNFITNATEHSGIISGYLKADGATNAQRGHFMADFIRKSSDGGMLSGFGTSAEDSTGALTLDFTWEHGVADALMTFTMRAASLRLITI